MKTKIWSANAFTNALDSCITNASTIFQEGTGKKIKYMGFGKTSCGSSYPDKVWTSSEWGKMRNIESWKPTANNWSGQHHNWCYTCIEEIRGKEESKKLKNSLAKVKKECEKWK